MRREKAFCSLKTENERAKCDGFERRKRECKGLVKSKKQITLLFGKCQDRLIRNMKIALAVVPRVYFTSSGETVLHRSHPHWLQMLAKIMLPQSTLGIDLPAPFVLRFWVDALPFSVKILHTVELQDKCRKSQLRLWVKIISKLFTGCLFCCNTSLVKMCPTS